MQSEARLKFKARTSLESDGRRHLKIDVGIFSLCMFMLVEM